MKKRLMSLALSVTLLLGVTPLCRITSSADTLKYNLWVNSERLTSTTLTVKCGSGTAQYDPDENVLILNNAQITLGSAENGSKSGILSQIPDLKIEVNGTNKIENTGGCAILASAAQNSPCAISITGDGSLTLKDTSSNGGLQCSGKLDISGTTLNVDSTGPALLSNSDVSIKNSKVTASAGGTSNAISSQSGKVTISGSEVSVTCTSGSGIYLGSSSASLTVKDSTLTDSASYGIRGANSDSCSISFENSNASINTANISTTVPEGNITLKSCYVSAGSFSKAACDISNKPLAINVTGGRAYIKGKYGAYISEAMPGNIITVVPDTVSGKYVSKWSCDGLAFDSNGILCEFKMPAKAVTLKPVYANQKTTTIVFENDRTVVGEDIFLSLVNMYGEPATDTDSLVHVDLDGDGSDDLYGYRSDYSFEIQPSSSISAKVFTADKPTVGKYSPITLQMVDHIHEMEHHKFTDSTCSAKGSKEYYQCTKCFMKFLDEEGTIPVENEGDLTIQPKPHTPGTAVDENIVNASCEEAGSKDIVTYCSVCGTELSRNTVSIPATGHKWTEYTTVREPTEDTEGIERRVCVNCSKTEERDIPKLSHVHKAKYISPVAPTCTEEGCEGYYQCQSCLRTFSDKDCTEEIDIDYLKIPRSEHEWDGNEEFENRVEPTCEGWGSQDQVKHCKHCGVEISREYQSIQPTGHRWGEWIEVTPAGEDTYGEEKHTCLTCGAVDQRSIPPHGHIHDMIHFPAQEATCAENGTKEYYQCRDCKRMYFDEAGTEPVNSSHDLLILALWHNFGKPVIENKVDATADKDGHYDEVVYCTRCGLEMSRKTVVIPHKHDGNDPDYKDDVYNVILGDADRSGKIDIEDVVNIMQHINGVKALTGLNAIAADVDIDEKITISDVAMIVNHINGVKPLADSIPVKKS